ncbi:MAG: hypothetical protein ACE37H_11680 [Phycisphaeraceae bacterium]
MRWFGIVYTPLMAVLGLLFIVLSFFVHPDDDATMSPSSMLIAGSILAAGATISGAVHHKD